MNYSPNADAAMFLIKHVLPIVRKTISTLEVIIPGRDPSPDLLTVAKAYPDTTVTGAVPDIRPYLERADVFVAPLRMASGVQNKVLEAMAMEVPVVTTPVVAEGLRTDGIEPPLLIGNDAKEIAECIIRILRRPQERTRLSIEGRRFVMAHHSWSTSVDKLEELCFTAYMSGALPADENRTSSHLSYDSRKAS
jgi:glycosyltransferase involved in cell wall biosynthesis